MCGAGGARISSKANQMYVLGPGGQSTGPVTALWTTGPVSSINSSLSALCAGQLKAQIPVVLQAHHRGVVLA
jgi:hypothetical protein